MYNCGVQKVNYYLDMQCHVNVNNITLIFQVTKENRNNIKEAIMKEIKVTLNIT